MCGIAAGLGVAPARVLGAGRGVAHRGPDAFGLVSDAGITLAAARLRVNGDASSDMPLRSSSGLVEIVGNAEVFNHADLWPQRPGASDLSGVPDLIEREGVAALARLRGPFALAVLDRRDRSLLIARDELGVRPLFFRRQREAVLVASEIPALLAGAGPLAPDPETWAFAIAFHFWPRERTPWLGVESLAPGSWLKFRSGEAGGITAESGRIAFRAREGSIAAALDEAFALQALRGAKTAVTLSGGVDSSAVLALLARAGAAPDLAVVGWFPGADAAFDERAHAERVAAEVGVPIVHAPITATDFMVAWEKVVRALGGPLAGPGAASQWLVARRLSGEGVRVAYSGQGGDELFGGYERYRVLQQLDAGGPARPAAGYEGLVPAPGRDPLAHLLFRGAPLLPLLDPEVARTVVLQAASLPRTRPRSEAAVEFEIEHLLPGLLAVDDRCFGAFGIEGRVPLLDPVLAQRARALPLAVKSPIDAPRRLFREILGERLPTAARARTDKMGFPVPLAAWFEGPLRRRIEELLADRCLAEVGFRGDLVAAFRCGRLPARLGWFLGSAALALEAVKERPSAFPAAAAGAV